MWDYMASVCFAVANKFPGIIAMIFTIFVSSWQISVLEEYGKDGYASFYNKIFRGVLLILLVLLVIVTFISKWLVSFFTSSDYLDAWIYIPVLTLGIFFSCVSGLAGSTFFRCPEEQIFFLFKCLWRFIFYRFQFFANTVVGYLGSSPVRCPVVYGYVGLKGCV